LFRFVFRYRGKAWSNLVKRNRQRRERAARPLLAPPGGGIIRRPTHPESPVIRASLATALALVALPALGDDPKPKGPPAADVLSGGLAAAKKEGKAVFLAFGSPTCGWCKYLDKFHARPAVEKTLGGHLVFVKVDVAENPGGEDLYKKYAPGTGGVPVWVILSADGKVLADSFEEVEGKKRNVGFPYEPNELAHYEKALRDAVPKLTDAEVGGVMKELKESGPERQKKGEKK
jgi:thiol-disulfide isomerase/thioredoxin